MSKVIITDQIDHDVMYEAEQVSYTPEVRAIWTKEHFLNRRSPLPAIGFAVDGKAIGGVYMDEGFIHVSILPEYQGKWAFAYGRGLEWAMSHADPVYAGIISENQKCIRYAEHSGWEKIGSYNGMTYYRSTRKFFDRLMRRRERQDAIAA